MKLFRDREKFKITNPVALLEWILLALLVVALTALLLFWHRNFYQTITQAEIILVLSKEGALQDIELEKFERVLRVHEFKTSKLLPEKISDPF